MCRMLQLANYRLANYVRMGYQYRGKALAICILLLRSYVCNVIFIQEFDDENLMYECVFLDMETL